MLNFKRPHFGLSFWIILMVVLSFNACTTYRSQFGSQATSVGVIPTIDTTAIIHRVFFTASAFGDSLLPNQVYLKKELSEQSTNSSLIFVGNSLGTQAGFSNENDSLRNIAIQNLSKEFALSEKFKGKTFFIPGIEEWKPNGQASVLALNAFFKSKISSQIYFTPKKGCGIETVQLHEQIILISLDSQWFLEDWDKNENMNAGCQNQTREMLLDELAFILSQNQNKTVLLAMHHPLFSNGISGGQFSLKDQLYVPNLSFPVPILASFYHVLSKSAGWNPEDLQHASYRNFTEKIKNAIKKYGNVVVISGKEKNLQYIHTEGIHQAISGSGFDFSPVRAIRAEDFSFGGQGFGVLNFYESGAVKLDFKSAINEKPITLFSKFLLKGKPILPPQAVKKFVPKTSLSIYDEGTAKRGKTYQFLWGKHHSKTFQTPFETTITDLHNLFGGLKPIGLERYGTASYWVFEAKDGKKYWAMPLQKEVSDFLQTQIFQSQSDQKSFQKKITEDFFKDYFTTSYPFAPLITASLEKEIGLKTAIPTLYYVSNSTQISFLNTNMKSGHYFITEKPSTAHQETFQLQADDYIVNTDDLLFALKSNSNHKIDKKAYIKARLLDMLVGDWNRNPNFYRWIAHVKANETIYEPIPFQRDQAFGLYDGFLLSSLKKLPAMGSMFSFKHKIPNLYPFNETGFVLDVALLNEVNSEAWINAAKEIQRELTYEKIQDAFANIPSELQKLSLENGAYKLKNRLNKLTKTAENYASILAKNPVITGSNKEDKITVSVVDKGFVQVTIYDKNDLKNPRFNRIFSKKSTQEIIIYGLEGNDEFVGVGLENCPIKIRLIGGQGLDSYEDVFAKKVHIYDFESNEILKPDGEIEGKITLANDYDTNIYQNQIIRKPTLEAAPLFGFNPDDGLRMGLGLEFKTFGFAGKPFSQQHNFATNYYFATEGYDLQYDNQIKNVVKKWDFVTHIGLTSANFAINFFGYGNESLNPGKELGFNFNRVKMRTMAIQPGLRWQNKTGSSFSMRATFDAYEVDETANRYIEIAGLEPRVFTLQSFVGFKTKYQFSNQNKTFDPTLGFRFFGQFSWQTNTQNFSRQVPVLEAGLWTIYQILPDAYLLLETSLQGKRILSNTFEFYQAATLGGDSDLRGFRDQRFTGKNAFFQQTNLSYKIGQLKNPFAPIYYGLNLGYDYGRVWMPFETSTKWHQSVGGGVWFNAAHLVLAKAGYFRSSDGGRISFGMRYNF